jgi:predicted TIM-barrel fold metal-dependent hydrolase
MIIDTHTHIWPEKVASSAQANLQDLFKIKFVATPTVAVLKDYMKKNNVDISVVCAVATKPQQVSSINDWMFTIKSATLKTFCAMHPDFQAQEQEIKRIKKYGDGIKMQPEFQNFYIDDERVFPLYELIEHNRIPLLFHTGEELSGTMKVRSSPKRLLKIRKQFPALTIIAAHFGGFRLTDEVEECLIGKDIYMDTSFFFDYVECSRVRKLLLAHRPDRLLFGSDFPLVDPIKDILFIKSLDLPENLTNKIFFENAIELLKI